MLVSEERGKPEDSEENLSGQSREPITKLNPRMTPGPRIKPGTPWWEASALTTAPTMLPKGGKRRGRMGGGYVSSCLYHVLFISMKPIRALIPFYMQDTIHFHLF